MGRQPEPADERARKRAALVAESIDHAAAIWADQEPTLALVAERFWLSPKGLAHRYERADPPIQFVRDVKEPARRRITGGFWGVSAA